MAKQNKLSTSQIGLIESLISEKYKDGTGILSEIDKASNVNMKLNIVNHRLNYLLYKLDNSKGELFPYFSDKSGLKKFCDYLLFVEENNYLYLFLIELKRGTISATKQLKASNCFAEFLFDTARRIGLEISGNLEIRKIRISEERTRKSYKGYSKPKDLIYDENEIINYDRKDSFRIKEIIAVN